VKENETLTIAPKAFHWGITMPSTLSLSVNFIRGDEINEDLTTAHSYLTFLLGFKENYKENAAAVSYYDHYIRQHAIFSDIQQKCKDLWTEPTTVMLPDELKAFLNIE